MSPSSKEILVKESSELERLWKDNPLLKKQKVIKEKMIRPRRRRPSNLWSHSVTIQG
jgi:hypothetical protein